MPGTTLYVVDMQPNFTGSLKICDEVEREILLAKRRKDFIVFVELNAGLNGHTLLDLVETATKKYDKVLYTTKTMADGSEELIEVMKNSNALINRVRVCGVNRTACVYHTVKGLTWLLEGPKIEVACNATIDSWGNKKWGSNYEDKDYEYLVFEHGIKLLFH